MKSTSPPKKLEPCIRDLVYILAKVIYSILSLSLSLYYYYLFKIVQRIKIWGFTRITRFIVKILIEHVDKVFSADSWLKIITLCSIRIRARSLVIPQNRKQNSNIKLYIQKNIIMPKLTLRQSFFIYNAFELFKILKMFDFQHMCRISILKVLELFDFFSIINYQTNPFLRWFVDRKFKTCSNPWFRTIFNYFTCAPEIHDFFL